MIALTYLGSAAVLVPTAILFQQKSLTQWSFIGLIMGAFFLASAGASAAYLTASEIFPMETRALAIAFFYAVGTAAGGITGPLFFGKMIDSGSVTNVMIAFLVGAAVMAVGGVAEIFLGVDAEQVALEDIAKPLTAREAEEAHDGDGGRREPRRDEETVSQRHRAREARRSRGVYGARRFRPGPGTSFYSPGMIGTAYTSRRAPEHDLDSEVDAIASALEQDGPADRRTLSRRVRAQRWGPGRFSGALHEALAEGVVRRRGRLFEAVTQRAREQQAERERTTR
jgi:MFS family permease